MRPGGFAGFHAFGPSCRFTASTARSFKRSQISALSRSGLTDLTFDRAGSGPTDQTYMPPLRAWTGSLWQSVLPQCWQETRHEAPAMSSRASKRVVRCDKAN